MSTARGAVTDTPCLMRVSGPFAMGPYLSFHPSLTQAAGMGGQSLRPDRFSTIRSMLVSDEAILLMTSSK
jgi:hypothetical protein